MKLRFLGATRQVTGSRYCLETSGVKLLVDCGMFQERKFLGRNWQESPVPADEIDAVVLTHAHLDHCGLIPRLVQKGFQGPIISTAATADLAAIVLRDSAHIQEEDAAYKAKRHRKEGRRGKYPEIPLYTAADAEQALPHFKPAPYGRAVTVKDGISVTFHDAGHILGSAILEFRIQQNGQTRRVVFSGDLGRWDKPLVRDPTLLAEADYVVMESTYGDRDHGDTEDVQSQLAQVLAETLGRGGNVVIPTFAVERAQELMYHISRLVRTDRIPDVPVFLNSPMAVDVTEVFRRHRQCLDEETWQLITSGEPPLRFPGLRLVRSVEESKRIHEVKTPAIIMATSGMCTAGRIKHHLRHNITRPECTILFVGYQAHGTLGRKILNGDSEVRIHGQHWPVRAQIAQIHGASGHADRADLIRWLSAFRRGPQRLMLTHGEEEGSLALAQQVRGQFGWQVTVPEYQQTLHLA
jgi:metallo-beta-lactamase family protein